jgi:hypothetical protein
MATAAVNTIPGSGGGAIEPLLTLEDVARILGRSHWTLRLDHKAGRIKCVRIGRALMVEPGEVRRIIQQGLNPVEI